MGVNGLLTDVRWEWTGTEVTADLLTGATVIPVLDPEAMTEDESLWIAGTGPYEIVTADLDADTFTITPGLTVDVENGTEVVRDIGGQPGRAWVGEVILPDSDSPIEVPLTVSDLSVIPEGAYDPPVAILLTDDMERVLDLPGSDPVINLAYSDPESIEEAGITPITMHEAAVQAIEAEIEATNAAIAAGDTANDQALAAAVDDYNAKFDTVDEQLSDIDDELSAMNSLKHTNSTSPPGATANVAGEVWEQYDNLGSSNRKLLAAWQGLGGNAWVSISLDPVYIPILDVNTATVGNLSSKRVIIADPQNYIIDFTNAQNRADYPAGGSFVWNSGSTDVRDAWRLLHLPGTGVTAEENMLLGADVEVLPGQVFRFTYEFYKQSNVNYSTYLNMIGWDTNWTVQTWDLNAGIAVNQYSPSDAWTQISGTMTVPPGVYKVRPYLKAPDNGGVAKTGGTYFRLASIRRMYGGSLIVDGSITANHIAAKAITTDKLLVSDMTNLITDPWFDGFGWTYTGTAYVDNAYPDKSGAASGVLVMFYGTSSTAESNFFDVKPGEQYNLTWDMTPSDNPTGSFVVRLRWFDADHVNLGAPYYYTDLMGNSAANVAAGWKSYAAWAPAPPGAKYGMIHLERYDGPFNGYLIFDNMRLNRRFGGELLVDGTVTARHITADMVNGLLVTGGVIQTSTAPKTGIKIDSLGLVGYNQNGDRTTVIDPNTGKISAQGSFFTASGGDDIEIYPGTATVPAAVKFWSNGAYYDTAQPAALSCFDSYIASPNPIDTVRVRLQGAKMTTATTVPRIDIVTQRFRSDGGVYADIEYHAGGYNNFGDHLFYSDNSVSCGIGAHGVQIPYNMALQVGYGDGTQGPGSTPGGWMDVAGNINGAGNIEAQNTIYSNNRLVDRGFLGGGITGASFNNNGVLIRTSTINMKESVEEMTEDEARSVLGLKSYTYEMKQGELDDFKDPRRYPGFIAEQGAETGAELWVARQHKVTREMGERGEREGKKAIRVDRDKNGEIIGFRTEAVAVAHNWLIKDLYAKIEELKGMITNA